MKKLQWRESLLFTFVLVGVIHFSLLYAQDAASTSKGSDAVEVQVPLEEQTEEIKERLKDLRELQKLIDVARTAGFTDEELQEITIERGGETINVWNFVIQEKERFKKAKKAKEAASKKKYITVKDITDDLTQKEINQISNLRESLIFSGEEE
ncbi:MAG: hypothetical protein HQM14_06750 [SAR324 cluster bacterium]|nr:hypothetical protein [SAR324 cluster bacterium]